MRNILSHISKSKCQSIWQTNDMHIGYKNDTEG